MPEYNLKIMRAAERCVELVSNKILDSAKNHPELGEGEWMISLPNEEFAEIIQQELGRA